MILDLYLPTHEAIACMTIGPGAVILIAVIVTEIQLRNEKE